MMLVMATFTACGSTLVPYAPKTNMPQDVAIKTIEQVSFEQHVKYRPEHVAVTPEYMHFSQGSTSRGVGIVPIRGVALQRSKLKSIQNRVYFNNMSGFRFYTKRNWFIVFIAGPRGEVLHRTYCYSREKATDFMDAVASLKRLNEGQTKPR